MALCMVAVVVGADDGWEDFICFGTPTDTPVAHPTNCSLFYLCDGGVGYKNQCPPNTLFDPAKLECHPNYRCSHPSSPDSPNTSHESTTLKPTWTTLNPTSDVTKHAIECPPIDTPNVTMLANPTDYSEYYMCYNGKPMRFECPRRYEFSSTDKMCIPAEQRAAKVGQSNPRCFATHILMPFCDLV